MATYLSKTPVSFTPTPAIRDWDGKDITITVPSGGRTRAKLRVVDADPNGPDAGKCSVIAWHDSTNETDEIEWTDAGSGKPLPTTQTHEGQRFLTADALIQAKQDEDGSLLLELSMDEI